MGAPELPKNGLFWPKMATVCHKQSQQPQMGLTWFNIDVRTFFGPKWPYLAIGSPSKPKWVEHWLNMVEHCQTHPGGSVWAFRAPKCHFLGAKRVQTHPPRCEIQCSTMFNQCSTHLGLLGPPMAKYGHFGPKMAIFGHKNGQNH